MKIPFFKSFLYLFIPLFLGAISSYASESNDFAMIDDSFVSVPLYAESEDIVVETTFHEVPVITQGNDGEIQEFSFILQTSTPSPSPVVSVGQGGGADIYDIRFPIPTPNETVPPVVSPVPTETINPAPLITPSPVYSPTSSPVPTPLPIPTQPTPGEDISDLHSAPTVEKKEHNKDEMSLEGKTTIESNTEGSKEADNILYEDNSSMTLYPKNSVCKQDMKGIHPRDKRPYHSHCLLFFIPWCIVLLLIFILGMCTQYLIYRTFFVPTDSDDLHN